ncbi:N-acetyltransferase [Dictyobacter sp. S3.2.2.5]|uniref:N-acetyltransferase n=1 Tax=Dictyobacter halimunensis TaxID=3026934 RepID=A0ABQ6FQ18_9CHLR|nr:N-acetyltransferase [Dictyobacter sp. S3.2.2.5]GLV54903.1 N-acetyltransferase [Dictyobacter sp. S3.2.2.5]
MTFKFVPMTEQDVRLIAQWRYEEPYDIYNMVDADVDDALAEMLDPRSPHYTVRDEEEQLIGFASFGTSALVWSSTTPAIYDEDQKTIAIGLGMRPDLTGQGLGTAFVTAILEFARERFAPEQVRLFVLPFNQRAIRLYEKVGFKRSGSYIQKSERYGEREFIEMRRSL